MTEPDGLRAEGLHRDIRKLILSGQFDAAEQLLDANLDALPRGMRTSLAVQIDNRTGRHRSALERLTELPVGLRAGLVHEVAAALKGPGEEDEARRRLDRIPADRRTIAVEAERADLALRAGKPAEALAIAQEALSRRPEDGEAVRLLFQVAMLADAVDVAQAVVAAARQAGRDGLYRHQAIVTALQAGQTRFVADCLRAEGEQDSLLVRASADALRLAKAHGSFEAFNPPRPAANVVATLRDLQALLPPFTLIPAIKGLVKLGLMELDVLRGLIEAGLAPGARDDRPSLDSPMASSPHYAGWEHWAEWLGVPEPERAAWLDRVAWSSRQLRSTNRALGGLTDMVPVVGAQIQPPDWTAVRRLHEAGRPIIFTVGHFGILPLFPVAMARAGLPMRLKGSREDMRDAFAPHGILFDPFRSKGALEGLRDDIRWLRDGGIIARAADGDRGRRSLTIRHRNGIRFSLPGGIPDLARRCGATIFWGVAGWRNGRLVCEVERFDEIEGESDDDFRHRWGVFYLDRLWNIGRADIRNVRLFPHLLQGPT